MIFKVWGSTGSMNKALTTKMFQERVRKILLLAKNHDISDENKIDHFIQHLPLELSTNILGATTSFSIEGLTEPIVIDAGSGILEMYSYWAKNDIAPQTLNLFFTHTHWDHILGFPFFPLNYKSSNDMKLYSGFEDLLHRLAHQQNFKYFPVEFSQFPSNFTQTLITEENPIYILDNQVKVKAKKLYHPGGCFAYRFEHEGKSIIIATDGEYYIKDFDEVKLIPDFDQYIEFYKNADILLFDSQYSDLESRTTNLGWGHSSPQMALNIAKLANVRNLVLTHFDFHKTNQEIAHSFESIQEELKKQEVNCEVHLAYTGLEIVI